MDERTQDGGHADGDHHSREAEAAHAAQAPLVVVLAGGDGRRIGGGKPKRELAGEPLIHHALRLARRWSDDVRVAIRKSGQAGELAEPELVDDAEIAGPLAGLASALRAALENGRAHVLTIPCDTPFLPDDLADRLSAGIGGHKAGLAASGEQLHPACALWRVDVLDDLPGYLASGRRSLAGFADTIGYVRVEVAAAELLNVNDAEGLALAELRLSQTTEHEPKSGTGDAKGLCQTKCTAR